MHSFLYLWTVLNGFLERYYKLLLIAIFEFFLAFLVSQKNIGAPVNIIKVVSTQNPLGKR